MRSIPLRTLRHLALAPALALTAVLIAAGGANGQIGLTASAFGNDYAASLSVWSGGSQGYWGIPPGRSGVSWTHNRYRFDRYVSGRWGHRHGWNACRDAYWDPWLWSWYGCGPDWVGAYWWGYPGWWSYGPAWGPYPRHIYHPARYRAPYVARAWPLHGVSVGLHVSVGFGWGSHRHFAYPRYAGWHAPYWDPWYDPWAGFGTVVFVDRPPRWVVRSTPRVVRVADSPRIGTGTWVSQAQFKESPRGTSTTRTAVARPTRQTASASASDPAQASRGAATSATRAAQPRPTRQAPAGTVQRDRATVDTRPARAPRIGSDRLTDARTGLTTDDASRRPARVSGSTRGSAMPENPRGTPRPPNVTVIRGSTRSGGQVDSSPGRSRDAVSGTTRSTARPAPRAAPRTAEPSRRPARADTRDRAVAPGRSSVNAPSGQTNRRAPDRGRSTVVAPSAPGRGQVAPSRNRSSQNRSATVRAPSRGSSPTRATTPRPSSPRVSAPRANTPRASTPRAGAPSRTAAPRGSSAPARSSPAPRGRSGR